MQPFTCIICWKNAKNIFNISTSFRILLEFTSVPCIKTTWKTFSWSIPPPLFIFKPFRSKNRHPMEWHEPSKDANLIQKMKDKEMSGGSPSTECFSLNVVGRENIFFICLRKLRKQKSYQWITNMSGLLLDIIAIFMNELKDFSSLDRCCESLGTVWKSLIWEVYTLN